MVLWTSSCSHTRLDHRVAGVLVLRSVCCAVPCNSWRCVVSEVRENKPHLVSPESASPFLRSSISVNHRDPLLVINAFTKPFQARGGARRVEGNSASVRGKVGTESWWQDRRMARDSHTRYWSVLILLYLLLGWCSPLYKGASRACLTGYLWNVKSGSYLGAFVCYQKQERHLQGEALPSEIFPRNLKVFNSVSSHPKCGLRRSFLGLCCDHYCRDRNDL